MAIILTDIVSEMAGLSDKDRLICKGIALGQIFIDVIRACEKMKVHSQEKTESLIRDIVGEVFGKNPGFHWDEIMDFIYMITSMINKSLPHDESEKRCLISFSHSMGSPAEESPEIDEAIRDGKKIGNLVFSSKDSE